MKIVLPLLAITLAFGLIGEAEAAKAKKSLKRSQFSKEEQAKIFKRSLDSCRKQHGDRLHNVEVDYTKRRFVCWVY